MLAKKAGPRHVDKNSHGKLWGILRSPTTPSLHTACATGTLLRPVALGQGRLGQTELFILGQTANQSYSAPNKRKLQLVPDSARQISAF